MRNTEGLLRGDFNAVVRIQQKPVALIKTLVCKFSRRGDTVVDFFGGTGTTMSACISLGRVGYGCELDHICHYYAVERLKRDHIRHL